MIPEVAQLNRASSLVRIPPADGVPLSSRVRRLIDTAPMRRLASLSQLGMVSLVYPGATHTRFEHSLGVYLNSLRLLARFSEEPTLRSMIGTREADAFVLAALLHDVGHWLFCHPIEDMQLTGLRSHEARATHWIESTELADCIKEDWSCEVSDIACLLESKKASTVDSARSIDFLRSCLSGPIDIDKLDYLQRDSLHAGVPYGHNFDVGRLIHSMCIHPEKPTLAISPKGRTAAEMMVFARYVMFSEVYWHHTVRAATAMLQRSVFELQSDLDLDVMFKWVDSDWTQCLVIKAKEKPGIALSPLVDGLFGATRRIYKRVCEFSAIETPLCSSDGVHTRIARRPYWWLVMASERLAEKLSQRSATEIRPTEILIDAPPVKLEVDINVDVISDDGYSVGLADLSPVARALAYQQFDNQVKRVRVFVHPEKRSLVQKSMPEVHDWSALLLEVTEELDREII